jgi:hypothetical protein
MDEEKRWPGAERLDFDQMSLGQAGALAPELDRQVLDRRPTEKGGERQSPAKLRFDS